MRTGLLACLLFGLSLPASGQSADALHAAIAASDTEAMVAEVEALYGAPGLSLDEALEWRFQRFDGIVNWYNQHSEIIMLSEMPRPEEMPHYWATWSAALTGGAWDWEGFFASEEEALLMANFNQFLLAAHEFGHALTYRYDPDHVARGNNEINCREYPADRLAASLLRELALADTRFAALEARYAELIGTINAAVADADRYTIESLAALEADCALISVVQPTETSMAPYASAYFARWAVLLRNALPSLKEVYEAHLLSHWRDRLPPVSPRAGALRSGEALADQRLYGIVRRGEETGWRLPGFSPDGALFVLESFASGEPGRLALQLAYGPAEEVDALPVFETDRVEDLDAVNGEYFSFEAVLPLGPGRVLAASADWLGFSGDMVVLDLHTGEGDWAYRAIQPFPGQIIAEVALIPDAAGGVALLVRRADEEGMRFWAEHGLDLDTFEVGPLKATHPGPDHPLARTADGELIRVGRGQMLLAGSPPMLLAGNGLRGFKDGAPPEGELANIFAVVGLPDHVAILDRDPRTQRHVIRRVELAPPE